MATEFVEKIKRREKCREILHGIAADDIREIKHRAGKTRESLRGG